MQLKNDRIIVYSSTYSWILQTLTTTEIFNWNCNYYENTSSNLWQSWLSLNTDSEKIEVIIQWTNNSIEKNMICKLYDNNWNLYWKYKIVKVKKNKSITWKIDNTRLIVTNFDGSENW